MQQRGEERREFQRLRLDPSISATFGSIPVSIVEVGVLGARLQHLEPIENPRAELRFTWEGSEVAMRCEAVRNVTPDQTGVRFLAAIGDSGDRLRAMLAQLVERALDDRNDSSATKLAIKRGVDGDKTIRGVDAQFVTYRYDQGKWSRRHVFLPEQPALGFTVARGEDAAEMQRLCEVYEASDEEGRRLIRLFAELSVSHVLQIPPKTAARVTP
jgi:hypothetical protein